MKIFLSLLFIFFTGTLYAQIVKSINYDGMMHLSKPVAKKYFDQGYFNDIWAEFTDGNLTFYFKEKAIISQVELKGWKENDDDVKDSVKKRDAL